MSTSQKRLSTHRSRRFGVGLVVTALAAVSMPLAATSASALLDPNVAPTAPHVIEVSAASDMVLASGYAVGERVTVEVVRRGVTIGTSGLVTADAAGVIEVNHTICWVGVTPDIRPGDVVRVRTGNGGDQTTVRGITVTQGATKVNASTVRLKGTAVGVSPLLLEAGIISLNQKFSNRKGVLFTPGAGNLVVDAAGRWTATFSALTAADVNTALLASSESVVSWLGRDPAGTEGTTFEFGAPGGPDPAAGCFAPLAKGPSKPDMIAVTDTGMSKLDNLTANWRPTFAGATALSTATSVNIYVDNVFRGSAAVRGGRFLVQPNIALRNGRHTIWTSEVGPNAAAPGTIVETMGNSRIPIVIDKVAPKIIARSPLGLRIDRRANVDVRVNENVYLRGAAVTLKKTSTGARVAGVISYSARTRVATFNPTARLAPRTRYTATLTRNVKDLAGNSVKPATWIFETGG